MSLTRAVTLLSGSDHSTGFLVLRVSVRVLGESVYALVTTGVRVRVCVIDHHVLGRDREVNSQLVVREAALGLHTHTHTFQTSEFIFGFEQRLSRARSSHLAEQFLPVLPPQNANYDSQEQQYYAH